MSPLVRFSDLYFAFLLSGNVSDFIDANEALVVAVQSGASMGDAQSCMDSGHASAEMLTFMSQEFGEIDA